MNKTKEYFNSLKDLYYDDPNIKKVNLFIL